MRIFFLLFFVLSSVSVNAQEIDVEKLADAIYWAEGGEKATYAYGIRSVRYKNKDDARRICINTIKNNVERHKASGEKISYLQFLANRYAPIGCDNDNGNNQYWLKNVNWFLKHLKEVN